MADPRTSNLNLYEIGAASDNVGVHMITHYNFNVNQLDSWIGSHDVTSIVIASGTLTITATDGTTYTASVDADDMNYSNSTSGLSATQVQAAIDEIVTAMASKADASTTLGGYGITDAYTKTETDAKIEALDYSDTAVSGSYVTEVDETDGVIAVTREAADASPTDSSMKLVTSGGVKTALDAKQDTLTAGTGIDITSNTISVSVQLYHNIPRLVPKDITSYVSDGSIWDRLNGTNGYSFLEDLYVGDYFLMSRAISAYEQTQQYQATGSQYVTIAGINSLYENGDSSPIVNYNHLVMVPGQGFGGTQHFGRSRMNSSGTTAGGYVGSEMHTTTLGAVTSSGSTESTATINEQLYAEFGSHLKTTRELLSNAVNSSRYNRFGTNSGCTSGCEWTSCQAVLMSEIEVYGSIVWSSSGYDTGNANHQLPLFANSKQAINNKSAYYWLKDVASSTHFCTFDDYGHSDFRNAGNANRYVRPRFVLGA